MADGGPEVEAAGGIVWREEGGEVQVLLVHRHRYDDWTIPKGKLDAGESWSEGALREVREETGIEPALGHEVAEVTYRDQYDRPKRVRYWAMTVVADHGFEPDDEVGAREWLGMAEAERRCSYQLDRQVLAAFAAGR